MFKMETTFRIALSIMLISCLVFCAYADDQDDFDYVSVLYGNTSTSTEKFQNLKSINASSLTQESKNKSDYLQQFDETMPFVACRFVQTNNVSKYNEETQPGQFPWVVLIINDENNIFYGSGTLIAPDIVLTAASLFNSYTSENLTARAGEWRINSDMEILPHQNRSVKTIIKHSEYDSGIVNNIAILVLNMDFGSQPNIGTLCLPSPGAVFDYSACITAAWDHFEKPIEQSDLKRTDFQVQPNHECVNRLPTPYLRLNNTLDESLICAIDLSTRYTTLVNGGSALFCPMQGNPHRYTQAGIVIGSLRRGEVKTGLFVNVTHMMPWIVQQLKPRNIDLKYYLL